MLSLETYKLIHIIGLLLAFLGLGSAIGFAAGGGLKSENPLRKVVAIFHGLGLVLLLIGGFGMLAKLELMSSLPGWVSLKLVLWLVLGGAIALAYRKPGMTLGIVAFVGALGAYAALMKPF